MWQPIETAPKDNKRPLWLARFNDDGTMQSFDYNGSWERESESWEMPGVYYFWASENGNVEEPTHWMYQPAGFSVLPGARAQNMPKAVAYLDLGVGGYMDIGTDLTDEELATLPKGRHMLGVIGTYGVDGYALRAKIAAMEPTPEVMRGALRLVAAAQRVLASADSQGLIRLDESGDVASELRSALVAAGNGGGTK